jgi:hypothetical protein
MRISGILPSNAMAAAVKKLYIGAYPKFSFENPVALIWFLLPMGIFRRILGFRLLFKCKYPHKDLHDPF